LVIETLLVQIQRLQDAFRYDKMAQTSNGCDEGPYDFELMPLGDNKRALEYLRIALIQFDAFVGYKNFFKENPR